MTDNGKEQFGEETKISTELLTDYNIDALYIAAERRSGHMLENHDGSPIDVNGWYPQHIGANRRLVFYRYLRNWITARHGHKFKDKALEECFESVTGTETPYSSIELKNLEFLKKQEKMWSEKSKKAWELLKIHQEYPSDQQYLSNYLKTY